MVKSPNPYKSPDARSSAAAGESQLTPARGAALGAVAGVFWGATAGAVGAGGLGLVLVISQSLVVPGVRGVLENAVAVLVGAMMAGSVAALPAGAVGGVLLGVLASVNDAGFRRHYLALATLLGVFLGGIHGGWAGLWLFVQPPAGSLQTLAWVLLGTLFGVSAGALGALATARVLARLAWRKEELRS